MTDTLPELWPAGLAEAGRALPVPFALCLTSLQTSAGSDAAPPRAVRVVCHEILRLLPGRRLVARAEIDGQPAVLKLFLGPDAGRYRAREARGCAWLTAAGVATPALLGEYRAAPGAGEAEALALEYLPHARPVAADDEQGVAAAAGQLARLHRYGCRYRDLHLDNFLKCADGSVWVVDGDGVRRTRARALPERRSIGDLAVLCAQRPPLADPGMEWVYRGYAGERGWPAGDPGRISALAAATRRQRRRRIRRYLRKAQRDCSEFHQHSTAARWVVAVRAAWDESMAAFAADPEAAMARGQVLKDGNSATVVRVTLGDSTRVIKRYNVKSLWHGLRRNLRPTARFRLAWLNGQRLRFLEIPTARPLALVEQRLGPLRGRAYLVMEDLGDRNLLQEVEAAGLSEERLGQVSRLFRALAIAGLTHGDTKATNFLITTDRVGVVDLDAMRESQAGQEKDVARFLANFEALPEVRERFRMALTPGAGPG